MQLAPSVWGWHIKTRYKYKAVSSTGEHYVSSTLFFYTKKKKKSKTWRLSVVPFPLCNNLDPHCQDSSCPVVCVVGQVTAGSPPLGIPLHSLVMTLEITEAARAVSCQCLQAPTSVMERSCLTSLSAALGRISTRSARLDEYQRLVHSKLHKMTLLTLVPAGIY